MSKHNPGPWRVDGEAHDMAGSAIIRDAGGFPVASTRSWIKEQYEANARLVASSPRLLQALKDVVNMFQYDDEATIPGTGAYTVIMEAKAAIAEAEGQC
jgi:hypothetical protein